LSVADLLRAVDFEKSSRINKRTRFAGESPGPAAVILMVLTQQESTSPIVDALQPSGDAGLNAGGVSTPGRRDQFTLASDLFLAKPRELKLPARPSSAFSPSFVLEFKQTLRHAGILAPDPQGRRQGSGHLRAHTHDYWKLEDHFIQSA
jgi:hypothetical protein